MRPVLKSDKVNVDGSLKEYELYGDAKPDLIRELGDFCSYCGKHLTRSALAVEHIQPKAVYPDLALEWSNFLLACINCNSIKRITDTDQLQPFMPHTNNLLRYIEVLESGDIQIKETLDPVQYKRTEAYIDLVGLDRNPAHERYSDKDDRWEYRLMACDLAKRQLQKYKWQQTDIENITQLAVKTGFFTVWFLQFKDYEEVRWGLIHAFNGTKMSCFDKNNHFEPI